MPRLPKVFFWLLVALWFFGGLAILSASQPLVWDAWLTGGPNADPVRLENDDSITLADQNISKAAIWLHVSSATASTTVHVFTPSSNHYRVQGNPSQICYDERCEIFSESGIYVLLAQPVGADDEVGPYFARTFELVTEEEPARAQISVDVGSTNVDDNPRPSQSEISAGPGGTDTSQEVTPSREEEEATAPALPAGSGTVIERRTRSWLDLYWTRWPAGTETIYALRPGDAKWTRTQCLGTYDDYPNVDSARCDYWGEFFADDNYTQSGPRCSENPGQSFSILYRMDGTTFRLQVKCP